MKKFIFSFLVMICMAVSMNAQEQTNYAGNSKFTDNISVIGQGGVLTSFNNFFSGHTAMAPIVAVGVDKYVTPWLGFGVDARTLIGTGTVGEAYYNTRTTFDYVNVSGNAKLNIVNMFAFDGTRKFFEPVVYGGLGWGHGTAGNHGLVPGNHHPNYLTARTGVELNFNLGKERAWAVVVNPSVVWCGIDNGKLDRRHGNFELTAGVVYHFKNSNGKRSFSKAKLYDDAEVARLKSRIAELEGRKPHVRVVEKIVEKTVVANGPENIYTVAFAQNSADLTDATKAILDKVPVGAIVNVAGSTSPEGTVSRNETLAQERAVAVAKYLESRGVKIGKAVGGEAGRVAIVTVQ